MPLATLDVFIKPGMRSCSLGKFYDVLFFSGLRPRVGFPMTFWVSSLDITI